MKIDKKNILKGFMLLREAYPEFRKEIDSNDEDEINERIENWIEIFNNIDGEYSEANDDFIRAIKNICIKNKYVPTVAEIVIEMRSVWNIRYEKIKNENRKELFFIQTQTQTMGSISDKTVDKYIKLKEIYSMEQIITMVNKYQGKNKIKFEELGYILNKIFSGDER